MEDETRVVWAGPRDESQPPEWPLQMRPGPDDRRPVAAILERAVQETVRQRVVRRKDARTFTDVEDMRSVGKGYNEPDDLICDLGQFHDVLPFRRAAIRQRALHAPASFSSNSRLRSRPQR